MMGDLAASGGTGHPSDVRIAVPWSVRIGLLAALAAVTALHAAPALAQETCEVDGGMMPPPPNFGGLDDFFPSDRSMSIPLDGFVRLRYVGVPPPVPVVQVQNISASSHPYIPGTIGVAGAEVHWFSANQLLPMTQYQVTALSPLDGMTTSFTFTTGVSATTGQRLTFNGVENIGSSRNGSSDTCGDPNAVTVTLDWSRANPIGWPETEVEYIIYETRGPGISGPVERGRERGSATQASCPNSYYCRSFRLSSENANGPVCFNVQASDPYGITDGNSIEKCIDPSRGNFFNGCSARPQTSRPERSPWLAGIVVSLLAVVTMAVVRGRRRSRAS
jgi:hypothetical protein